MAKKVEDMYDFSGKTVFITGATKGIGREYAEVLADHGANIVVASRTQADCDAVAAELEKKGVKAVGIAMDVTKQATIEAACAKAVEIFGEIDILINNAGSAITKKAELLTEADWDRVVGIDLKGVFLCSIVIGNQMIKQNHGNIINTASMLALSADKQVLPYCVAKGGVKQLTQCLAIEWAKYNIRVNAICPGYIRTEINAKDLDNEKISKNILSRTPMRRFASVDELDGAVLFLASEASSYMTGAYILLDGGRMAGA